jgi:heme/copper-type cytochrome/quinol oxidase subunit 1
VLFDDLSLLAKVLIAVMGPPIVTIFCWVVGPLLAGARRERTRTRSWIEFWLMLLVAYLVFAIALVGIHFHTGNDHGDPSLQLVH